jgi:hypothetical protein
VGQLAPKAPVAVVLGAIVDDNDPFRRNSVLDQRTDATHGEVGGAPVDDDSRQRVERGL